MSLAAECSAGSAVPAERIGPERRGSSCLRIPAHTRHSARLNQRRADRSTTLPRPQRCPPLARSTALPDPQRRPPRPAAPPSPDPQHRPPSAHSITLPPARSATLPRPTAPPSPDPQRRPQRHPPPARSTALPRPASPPSSGTPTTSGASPQLPPPREQGRASFRRRSRLRVRSAERNGNPYMCTVIGSPGAEGGGFAQRRRRIKRKDDKNVS